MSFSTGPGLGWGLESATLRAHAVGTAGDLTLALQSDSGGLPGAQITALSGPNPTVLDNYDYTPGGPITLAPLTTCWITASGTGDGDIGAAISMATPGVVLAREARRV